MTLIKSLGRWLLFDDDAVTQVDESEITKYYGDNPGTGSGYVLFYQAVDVQQTKANGEAATIVPQEPSPADDLTPTEVPAPMPESPMHEFPQQQIKKPELSLKTGLSLTKPTSISLQPPSPERTTLPSPTAMRETKKSFFGLGKRSASSKITLEEAQQAFGSIPPPTPPPPGITPEPPDLPTPNMSSTSLPRPESGQREASDAASTASSGAHQAGPFNSSAPPLVSPGGYANGLSHSPSTQSIPEKKSFGRFFGRSKSTRTNLNLASSVAGSESDASGVKQLSRKGSTRDKR